MQRVYPELNEHLNICICGSGNMAHALVGETIFLSYK